MDFFTLIVTVLVTLSFNIQQNSAIPVTNSPTGEPWKTPCSGTATAISNSAFTIPTPTISVTERLNSFVLKIQDTIELSSSLKLKIVELLQNDDLINYLEQGSELLQGFPIVQSDTLSLKENLKIDFERFATIYIFAEQSSIDSELKSEFKMFSTKMLNILCELQIISSHETQDIVSKVSRNVMLDAYRTLNLAQRTERDYLIIRDTTNILQSIISVYKFHAVHYS